jgi:putative transposase
LLAGQQFEADRLRPRCAGAGAVRASSGTKCVDTPSRPRLAETGIEPSAGSEGGSDDDALAATINGLYKVELIHRRAHCEAHEAVELATPEGVS